MCTTGCDGAQTHWSLRSAHSWITAWITTQTEHLTSSVQSCTGSTALRTLSTTAGAARWPSVKSWSQTQALYQRLFGEVHPLTSCCAHSECGRIGVIASWRMWVQGGGCRIKAEEWRLQDGRWMMDDGGAGGADTWTRSHVFTSPAVMLLLSRSNRKLFHHFLFLCHVTVWLQRPARLMCEHL